MLLITIPFHNCIAAYQHHGKDCRSADHLRSVYNLCLMCSITGGSDQSQSLAVCLFPRAHQSTGWKIFLQEIISYYFFWILTFVFLFIFAKLLFLKTSFWFMVDLHKNSLFLWILMFTIIYVIVFSNFSKFLIITIYTYTVYVSLWIYM